MVVAYYIPWSSKGEDIKIQISLKFLHCATATLVATGDGRAKVLCCSLFSVCESVHVGMYPLSAAQWSIGIKEEGKVTKLDVSLSFFCLFVPAIDNINLSNNFSIKHILL